MAYKIIETELAEQDLDNILGYIVRSLANPSAAASFADAVEACYSDLEKMPLMYELCRDPRLRALEYHKAVMYAMESTGTSTMQITGCRFHTATGFATRRFAAI